MNKNELIAAAAKASGVSKKNTAAVLDALLAQITDAVANGEKVQIMGFGTFETRERGERTSRNPRTGEPVSVPASKSPVFKPGKAFKETVNK